MKVSVVIAQALLRHGIRSMFSQSLPTALLLAAEDAGIRQLGYRTENAGAAMADCFARVGNRVTVVTAQNGPAASLLVPGLAEALKSSVPIVALVQDVDRPNTDRNAFQELEHLGLFQACAKWVRRVTEASRAEDYVDMAFTAATSGRPGPAVLLLPADLLNQEIEGPSGRALNLGAFPLDRPLADPSLISEAARLIAAAKRPLVIAGGGIHLSGAAAELAELQSAAHLPVTTTVMGKGAVDERHPLSIGVGGNHMGLLSRSGPLQALVKEADVIVLAGTRTAQLGTNSWTLYPHSAKYIHIDIDPMEVGRNYEALRLVGDAKLTIKQLTKELAGRRKADPHVLQQIQAAHARHIEETGWLSRSQRRPIRPERLMADLQSMLTPDTIVVGDASFSTSWISCYLTALAPGMRFITPRGLAGIGWGLPMALGAKLARPSSAVYAVVGDGGFAHVWSELETAKRLDIPIALTVLNNSILGYQLVGENVKFGRHTSACYFQPVDHAQIARACGCRGIRIEDPADYLPALKEAACSKVLTLLDVITDPAAFPPLNMFDRLDQPVKPS